MDMVGETIEQRAGKALALKDARPFLGRFDVMMVDPRSWRWLKISIAARPSFDQLAKGDLVEPDIHGTDMGRPSLARVGPA
jgi:hypothetical protein